MLCLALIGAAAILQGCSDRQLDRFLRDLCDQRDDCDVFDARPQSARAPAVRSMADVPGGETPTRFRVEVGAASG